VGQNVIRIIHDRRRRSSPSAPTEKQKRLLRRHGLPMPRGGLTASRIIGMLQKHRWRATKAVRDYAARQTSTKTRHRRT
jgi:hypothetical protein